MRPLVDKIEDIVIVEDLALELPGDEERRSQFVALAGRLAGYKMIALHPLSESIGVLPTGVELGLALAQVSGSTAALVDANHRWPALEGETQPGDHRHEEEHVFATRWIQGSLALLLPRVPGAAGAGLPALAALLRSSRDLFAHILIDLTGYKRLGELPAALMLCDGVVAIARAGETTEDELLRMQHELPPEKNLGTLLVGRS